MRSVTALVAVLGSLALFGPLLAQYDPTAINLANRLSPPGHEWLLGTDALGRDNLSRLLHGARWSLGLAFLISVTGLLIGTLVGLIAAQGGKLVDWWAMRMTDTLSCVPRAGCRRGDSRCIGRWHR